MLAQLAAKFAAAKFVSIVFNNCIPNYPESALPCVLVYIKGDLARQIVGVQEYVLSSAFAPYICPHALLGVLPPALFQSALNEFSNAFCMYGGELFRACDVE